MIQHFVPSKCNDVNALVVSTQSVRGDNKMLIFSDRLTGGRTGLNLPLSDKSDFTSDYVNRWKWWWDLGPDSPLWSAPQMRQCEPLKCARGSNSTSGCSEISAELVVLLVSVLFTTWTFSVDSFISIDRFDCRLVEKMAPIKKKGKKDLGELKKELELDEHKISVDDLYRRYGSDPKKVNSILRINN